MNTNSSTHPNSSMSSNLNPNTSNLGTTGLASNPSSFDNNISSGLGNNSSLGGSTTGGSSLGSSALGHSTFGGSSDQSSLGGSSLGGSSLGGSSLGGSSLGSSGHSSLGGSSLGGSSLGGSSLGSSGHSSLGSSGLGSSSLGGSSLGSSGHSSLGGSSLGGSSLGGSSLHTSNPPLGSTSIPGNTTTGPNIPNTSGYSGTSTGLLPTTNTYTGTTDNSNAYHAGSSSIASNHGLTSNQTGLTSNTSGNHHNTAATTAGAAATGAALGAAASHHDKHNHPHHHEHTGHHAHGEHGSHHTSGLTGTSDSTGRSGMTGSYDPNTQTGNPTAAGGALHKAGIGHDPSVNTTGPSTLGTAATAGAVGAGAGALAGHHHQQHGHHQGIGHDTAFASTGHHHGAHQGVGTAIPGQGTGLASGFAVTQPGVGHINPATGAPDYQAVQSATIHDNAAIPATGAGLAGAGVGAATGAAASKMRTASGLPKRVLMVVTSSTFQMPDGKNTGYHWSEVYHPFEVFKKHGYDVDITSINGRAEPDYHSVNWMEQLTGMELGAMNAWRSKSHPLHALLSNIKTPTQLQGNNYGIIYFTGGHGTLEDFPTAEAYQRMAAEIYERNGIVCAVCHGVAALGNVRLSNGTQLLSGKQVTGFSEEGEKQMKVLDFLHKKNYPLISDFVSRAGGIYQAPNKPFDEFVVDSDRVITGPNPSSAGPVADRAIRILEGR
jgi:putative intracellular protease/amidase